MSLFECLDRMKAALLVEGNAFPITDDNEKQFINEIIAELTATLSQTAEIQGKSITSSRAKIIAYLQVDRSPLTKDLLNYVARDLKLILNQMGLVSLEIPFHTSTLFSATMDELSQKLATYDFPKLPPKLIAYQQLLNSRFCLQKIQQGRTAAIGISEGECYGIAKAMLHPESSPYHGQAFFFDRTAYNYQKNQLDRAEDQKGVQRRRITRQHFCPSVSEQANRIYQHASQHTEKEFMVGLRSNRSAHGCYFSRQRDGKMRYMDPNHGAFLFDTREQFVAAYQLLYTGAPYQTYQISQLTLNPDNAPEKQSIQGKVRSLLTGVKYTPTTNYPVHQILNATVGLCVGGAIGAIIGSFIFPMIGTLIGAAVGSLLGGLSAYKASSAAKKHGHYGLLGPYHLLRQWFYERNNRQDDTPIQQLQETLGLRTEIATPRSSYTTMADHGLQPENPNALLSSTGESTTLFMTTIANLKPSQRNVDGDELKEVGPRLG